MADAAAKSTAVFQPWVAASEAPAELTFRAVALGSILGIVFGAASVYLGLKVGLTDGRVVGDHGCCHGP